MRSGWKPNRWELSLMMGKICTIVARGKCRSFKDGAGQADQIVQDPIIDEWLSNRVFCRKATYCLYWFNGKGYDPYLSGFRWGDTEGMYGIRYDGQYGRIADGLVYRVSVMDDPLNQLGSNRSLMDWCCTTNDSEPDDLYLKPYWE